MRRLALVFVAGLALGAGGMYLEVLNWKARYRLAEEERQQHVMSLVRLDDYCETVLESRVRMGDK